MPPRANTSRDFRHGHAGLAGLDALPKRIGATGSGPEYLAGGSACLFGGDDTELAEALLAKNALPPAAGR